jgi:ComF family protein
MLPLFVDLLELVYPDCCQGCREPLVEGEVYLCMHCESELPLVQDPNPSNGVMHKIFYGRLPVQKGASFVYFRKGDIVQELMHAIKYKGHQQLARWMGARMGRYFQETGQFMDVDFLIPVPLHPKKRRVRGFNQSEELAIGLGEALGISVNTDLVLRNKFTETQTKKGRFARWQNVATVFDCPADVFSGKHLLLVDDVITTGATLEACAWPLIRSGARVSMVTLALAT